MSSIFRWTSSACTGWSRCQALPAPAPPAAQTTAAVLRRDPDVLITIDSPDFCLRVARLVQGAATCPNGALRGAVGLGVAAGPGREDGRLIDHVLALLPFEPPYMEAAGMACDFVGHPVVSERQAATRDIAPISARHGIGDAPLLLVLPGSRAARWRSSPRFRAGAAAGLRARPDLRLVVPPPPPGPRRCERWSPTGPAGR